MRNLCWGEILRHITAGRATRQAAGGRRVARAEKAPPRAAWLAAEPPAERLRGPPLRGECRAACAERRRPPEGGR
eukprot:1581617-Prymnesium_polylepis.1